MPEPILRRLGKRLGLNLLESVRTMEIGEIYLCRFPVRSEADYRPARLVDIQYPSLDVAYRDKVWHRFQGGLHEPLFYLRQSAFKTAFHVPTYLFIWCS